ncbi:MAG: SpoIIE family protein phosphatase [Cytophagales bacterium]|nr:SpoIIE family protein phosphatase [Cytophagales bacterium]
MNKKELEIRALLEITEAINNNLSEQDLYRIFYFTCITMFKAKKMAFVVLDEKSRATCVANKNTDFGTDQLKAIEGYLTQEKNTFFSEKNQIPHLNEFDFILSVQHKKKSLAYILMTDVDGINCEEDLNKMSFLRTMANIIMVAIENKRLVRRDLKQEAYRKEMEIAKNVQTLLVPKVLPNNNKISLYSSYFPHSMVSGDYYDFVEISEDEVMLCIADVSGKGMAAALVMSNFQACFRTLARQKANLGLSLQDAVHELNHQVFSSAQGEKFITFFVANIDLKAAEMEYINAGHNAPILLTEDTLQHLKTGTLMLGAFPKLPFLKSEVIPLEKNSLLFTYTDGIVETNNNIDEPFGEERLDTFLRENFDSKLAKLHENMIIYLDEFKQNQPYFDDLTLLSFRFKG